MADKDPAITRMSDRQMAANAYFAATADGPFDHQRDAYEQGWEDGAAHRPCMLCDDLRAAREAERQRIRQALATRLRDVVDPSAYADLLDGAS